MGKSNTELLKIAQKYLGQGGSVFQKYCGLPSSAAWCCAFVTYIFNAGGDASLFYGGKKVVYCPTAIKWCDANLAKLPIYLAMPMDVIFFDWNANNIPDHIGFVREPASATEIKTLEGNTSNKVAYKTRPSAYVLGVYRPHYKASYKLGALTVDGICGYNTIANLQKALGITVDGILGRGTVKALQKKVGVTQDGAWGTKTSKAVQKLIGATQDGLFGKKSVEALQKWINKQNGVKSTATASTSTSWQDKANAWAKSIAASGKYKYKNWSPSNANTHKCPICHPGTGNGWNCIGFAFACWRHGGGLKSNCSCSTISNGEWEKILAAKTQEAASKLATQEVGIPVTAIRNGGKTLPISNLKKGDIIAFFNGNKYYHTAYYMGDGKYADSTSGRTPNIKASVALSTTAKKNLKVAIRYTGK